MQELLAELAGLEAPCHCGFFLLWLSDLSPAGKWWSARGLEPQGIMWQHVDLLGALSGGGVTWVVRFRADLLDLYWLRCVLSLKQEGNMPGTEIFSNSCAFLGSFS